MKYIVYNATTGEIIRSVDCQPEQSDIQIQIGESILQGEPNWGHQYVIDGILTEYTDIQAATKAAIPKYPCAWSNITFSWTDLRALSELKKHCWESIKLARTHAITSPLHTPYGIFDADVSSQKNIIDAIILMQHLENTQNIEFIRFDNSVVELTILQLVEIGSILGQRTQHAYATSTVLRNQIDTATTVSEIETISWPS